MTISGLTPLRLVAYTDYKSPYAYAASRPTLALAVKYPLEIVWLPYTLRIAEYLGSVENRDEHQWRKVRYAYMDARRYAAKQGLTIKGPKRIFDGYLASVGMLYAQREDFFASYHEQTFDRFWRRELDIEDIDVVLAVLANAGATTAGARTWMLGEGRALLDEQQPRIFDAGVFGVPTYVLDGETFFGREHLPWLYWKLAGAQGPAPDIGYAHMPPVADTAGRTG